MSALTLLRGNQLEALLHRILETYRQDPLDPFQDEYVIVQSNGIGQWFRHTLARQPAGIAMAVTTMLPAQFQWWIYRTALERENLPLHSAFDTEQLMWRLMRILPLCSTGSGFENVSRFLQDDSGSRKLHRLAMQTADLFDQYQMYREDWLRAWEGGELQAGDIPRDQQWQPLLWQGILQDMSDEDVATRRGVVHHRFLNVLEKLPQPEWDRLPRRVTVFGVSSLPPQIMEMLHHLARRIPVTVAVLTPTRGGVSEALHPLVNSWAPQVLQYEQLLLQEFSRAPALQIQEESIFRRPPGSTRLHRLQGSLIASGETGEAGGAVPVASAAPLTPPDPTDRSITFHSAHSGMREVEVLHDWIVALLQDDPEVLPRDMVVMVPEIAHYAPLIEAVFASLNRNDPRYVPFRIADRVDQKHPLILALEKLLTLPGARVTSREVMELLQARAVQRRFGIEEDQIADLERLIQGAGIRWGLDERHRQELNLPAGSDRNTWRFGLHRLVLGYATGSGDIWQETLPAENVQLGDGGLIGALDLLIQEVADTRDLLGGSKPPSRWKPVLEELLRRWFLPGDPSEQRQLDALATGLQRWEEICQRAGFDEPIPVDLAKDGWIGGSSASRLSQPFLSGAVTFATLMPMRAVPFRHVFLLGMNEKDYPRRPVISSFDLMKRPGAARPGDRSRRDDDRFLFLEALLAARDSVYISWTGRDVRDNSERPPSVLVGQLMDCLGQTGADLQHPLQPFSRRYATDPQLRTYRHEWFAPQQEISGTDTPPSREQLVVTLRELEKTLKNPLQFYFEQILGARLDVPDGSISEDEPFHLEALEQWQLQRDILNGGEEMEETFTRLRLAGGLPLPPLDRAVLEQFQSDAREVLQRFTMETLGLHMDQDDRVSCPVDCLAPGATVHLSDELTDIFRDDQNTLLRVILDPGKYHDSGARPKLRLPKVWSAWVRHVAAQLCGRAVTTVIVSWTGTVRMAPLPQELAQTIMEQILAFREALRDQPIPLPPAVACAWIDAGGEINPQQAAAAVRKVVETARFPDRYLDRGAPDPLAIMDDPGFRRWANTLYRPFIDHMQDQR